MIRDLIEIYGALLPLYYVTQETAVLSRVLYAKETKFTPELVICHPDDLEEIKTMSRPLVHLRGWKGKQIEPCIVPTSDQEPIKAPFHDGGGV